MTDLKSIEFSQEASILPQDGEHLWNAFQMNSYLGRFEFTDGRKVVVAFPRGARSQGLTAHIESATGFARMLLNEDREIGLMDDE